MLGSLQVGLEILMVSFDAVFLFTQVPIQESFNLLSQHFSGDILALFRHVLTSTYFSVGGQFWEQTDGVAMGFLFYSVITNFFMEDMDSALTQASHKHDVMVPLCLCHFCHLTA
jgi:hypothetical protein